jgi:hypothetical protein
MDLVMNVVTQKQLPSFVFRDEEEADDLIGSTSDVHNQDIIDSNEAAQVPALTPSSLKKKQSDSEALSPSEFISPLKRTKIN